MSITDPFVTIVELAALTHLTQHTIRQYRSGMYMPALLKTLPNPVVNRPRLLWLRSDLESWLASLSTLPKPPITSAPVKRGPGRPRKMPQGGAA